MLLAVLAVSHLAIAQSSSKGVAVVNGQTITQQELDQAAANDLKSLETKRLQNDATMAQDKQEIMSKALEELVANKLLEAEAKKQNLTAEKLLENEVDNHVKEPSDTEVEGFYEAN